MLGVLTGYAVMGPVAHFLGWQYVLLCAALMALMGLCALARLFMVEVHMETTLSLKTNPTLIGVTL